MILLLTRSLFSLKVQAWLGSCWAVIGELGYSVLEASSPLILEIFGCTPMTWVGIGRPAEGLPSLAGGFRPRPPSYRVFFTSQPNKDG
ncbi:hypothetical protein BGZ63DRAFT_381631 [Mariannaea sp. PMI_226]|nr:hypothetical protein BGZ63DRAFT_381631 [Mariannaea sp. PMI_226]